MIIENNVGYPIIKCKSGHRHELWEYLRSLNCKSCFHTTTHTYMDKLKVLHFKVRADMNIVWFYKQSDLFTQELEGAIQFETMDKEKFRKRLNLERL